MKAATIAFTTKWVRTWSSPDGTQGTVFSVWAPNAHHVYGDRQLQRLESRFSSTAAARQLPESGRASSPGSRKGALYKFHIASTQLGYESERADPIAILDEKPPADRVGGVGSQLQME